MRRLRAAGASVIRRVRNRLQFQIELFVLRGPVYRLAAVALLIAFIALAMGLFVFRVGHHFGSLEEAVWWAFLRLTDPGYLGDDQGALLRSVSTVVTVLGYVLFLGALVAIMTQWFHETMKRLEAGLTPIVMQQHVLLLGWSNRTTTIVRELFRSEGRVERFLQRFGASRLRVVLLCEQEPETVAQELNDHLGNLWEPARFVLRSGTPLRLEHLERVDFLNASVILLPAQEHDSPLEQTVDGDVIKTLMTISNAAVEQGRTPPLVVAEVMDARKVALARRAYDGPVEVIAGDEFSSRLIAHNLSHAGLSVVYAELLGHGYGNEIYLRECPTLTGLRFADASAAFRAAVAIGIVRRGERQARTFLAPSPDFLVEQGDRFVLIAEEYDAAAPSARPEATPPRALRPSMIVTPEVRKRAILMLGWSHKAPALFRELDSYGRALCSVDVVSRTPPEERQELMDRLGVRPARVQVRQLEGDFTSASDLAELQPQRYDTVVILAHDWTDTDPSTDARTILGYLVLSELLEKADKQPHILVELNDPDNETLFRNKPVEVLVSPVLVSHVLTQVGLRRELRAVFEELFGPQGAEIEFRSLRELSGDAHEVSFEATRKACLERGEIAMGLRAARTRGGKREVALNPAREQLWPVSDDAEVIVLARD